MSRVSQSIEPKFFLLIQDRGIIQASLSVTIAYSGSLSESNSKYVGSVEVTPPNSS
jgi:hypothetical protein